MRKMKVEDGPGERDKRRAMDVLNNCSQGWNGGVAVHGDGGGRTARLRVVVNKT